MSEEISIESRIRLQGLLAEIKPFLNSPVHRFYIGQQKRDLDEINERILEDDVSSEADFYELLNRRGKRAKVIEGITFFEDAVAHLEERIEAYLNLENQTPQNTNENGN